MFVVASFLRRRHRKGRNVKPVSVCICFFGPTEGEDLLYVWVGTSVIPTDMSMLFTSWMAIMISS
jgi:hypothetical protein